MEFRSSSRLTLRAAFWISWYARDYGSGDHLTSLVLLNDTDYFANPLARCQTTAFMFTFELTDGTQCLRRHGYVYCRFHSHCQGRLS